MTDKIYVVTASANKGQDWIVCQALYGGILGSDIKKTAQAMLEEEYQDIKMHGKRIPRKYFKLVEYSNNAELLKQIEQLQEENATLKSNLGECEVGYSAALHYAREDNKKLQAENAALRERLSKAVELPYKRKRLLWGDKDRETLLCPDCLTDLMGGIGDETFVVQCPNCGCFVDCMVEPIPFTEAAEARLKEIKEENND